MPTHNVASAPYGPPTTPASPAETRGDSGEVWIGTPVGPGTSGAKVVSGIDANDSIEGDHQSEGTVTTVVLTAHGTRSARGRTVMRAFTQAIREAAPPGQERLRLVDAFVDAQSPALREVAVEAGRCGRNARLVPLLLSAGYHVRVDLERAATAAPGSTVAPALGPDPVLATIMAQRLRQAGLHERESARLGSGARHAIVMAAAGSSDPRAAQDVETMADLLAQRLGRDVEVAYVGAEPRLPDVVARNRALDVPTAVATYLLMPGFFARTVRNAGAEVVGDPLLPPEAAADRAVVPSELVQLVWRRILSVPVTSRRL